MTVAAAADSEPRPAPLHLGSLSTLALALMAGLIVVLIAGFLALVLTNHDTGTYVLFVSGPLVTAFTAAVIGHRVTKVGEVVKTVEAQTNGLLSKNLADIHEHLDQQTEELLGESDRPVVVPPGSPGAGRLPTQAVPVSAPEVRAR